MNRFLQSTFANVTLAGLLVLGLIQVWQLDRIESRLIGGATLATGTTNGAAAPTKPAVVHGSCEDLPAWKSDEEATAEPGNLLHMHTSCLVTAPQVARGGTIRRVWGQDPNGLNIYGDGGNSADVREIYRYVSNRMAYRQPDAPDTWSPELAQSVTLSDDGLVYTIRFRKGVKWQTPDTTGLTGSFDWLAGEHEFTSDDYLFVFENILNPKMAGRFAPVRSDFGALVKAEAPDRYTLRLTFNQRRHATTSNILDLEPLPRWLYAMDETGKPYDAATFPEKFLKHWYNQKAIGTGPYSFTEWKLAQSITLTRNAAFWGEPPAFDKVFLQEIQDKSGWPRALQNKELDFVHLLPSQYRTTVLDAKDGKIFGDDHVKTGMNPIFAYFYIGWNRSNPRFADKRVRQALTMAVDRQGLLDNVYYGLGEVLSGPLVKANSCYDQSVQPYPYDLARAAALLDEAGWKDTDGDGVRDKVVGNDKLKLELTLMLFGSSEEWRTIGNQVLESYRKIGIKVTLDPEEWATMQQRTKKRDFDAFTGSWVMDYEFDPRALWHSSTAKEPESINYIGFQEPEVDKLIESFETDFDEAHRLQTCHAFHQYMHDDEPYTVLFSRTTPVLWWDWMNDLRFFPSNPNRDLRYYSFATARP